MDECQFRQNKSRCGATYVYAVEARQQAFISHFEKLGYVDEHGFGAETNHDTVSVLSVLHGIGLLCSDGHCFAVFLSLIKFQEEI